MKYQRAKAGFIRYADSKLLVVGGRIIHEMKHSSFFTDPKPSLAEVEAAYLDYQEKVFKASGGGRLYTSAKQESKRLLADLLQELAFYVSTKSDGDLSKLHSSGFPVLEKRRKGQVPDTPRQPFLDDGRRSGEVAFGFKSVGRDLYYDYCFAVERDEKGVLLWGELRTTTRSFRDYADGFKPGSQVFFRVRARNRHGESQWTQPISLLVR